MGFSSFFSASSKVFLHNKHGTFWVNPILLPSENPRVMRLRKGAKFPVAAISEDLIKTTLTVQAEKPVQFKVRAVVTVRNKIKEDFKETMLKHFDAINDRIGTRNVVLELISTEIDPSKPTFHNSPFESFSFSSQVSKIDHYITKRSFNFLLSF